MRGALHPVRTAGLALGVLYVFEALFETGILFVVWPILGGIFAAALTRWSPEPPLTPGTGARAGAGAGLIGGLVLLILGTPITYWFMERLQQEPQFFGVEFGFSPLLNLIIILGIYALGGMLVAAAAGGLIGTLARERATERS